MDYAALFAAGVAGMAIGGGISDIINRSLIKALQDLVKAGSQVSDTLIDQNAALFAALLNLRANCFLTDTDGVRRRYDKVSRAVRERAEGGV